MQSLLLKKLCGVMECILMFNFSATSLELSVDAW